MNYIQTYPTKNQTLHKALLCCEKRENQIEQSYRSACDDCPYEPGYPDCQHLLGAAAEAIEKLEKEVQRLETEKHETV